MLCLLLLCLAPADGYLADTEAWRARREANLKAADGWLTLTGLHWLREGKNVVAGQVFELRGDQVFYRHRPLAPDNPRDAVHLGSKSLFVIKRGTRFAIRERDSRSPLRRRFRGLSWFPIDPAYRVEAIWRPYPKPERRSLATVVDIDEEFDAPGLAVFHLKGQTLKLEPVLSENQLFFVFKDLTAGKTTYPAGRFLYALLPVNGKVILDFNRAYTPPCAFTPYATCPLPRRENHLPIAIEAGEKSPH
jgi:uncharacterized protein (DUF1684 family)